MAELESRLPFAIVPATAAFISCRKQPPGLPPARVYGLLPTKAPKAQRNFLTSLLLARLCAPKQFGAYVLASSALLAGSGLQGALVTGPMTVLGAGRDGQDWKSYATTWPWRKSCWGS